MSDWTKGPWRIDKRASTRIIDDADTTIASAGLASRIYEEAMANTHLIAAAPDMATAIDNLLNSTDYCDDSRPLMDALRTALAKAEGK